MHQSKMVLYKAEEVLLREGEVCEEMYKIVSGKAVMYINYGKPNEFLVGILAEQRCFGEMSVLGGLPSMFTVVALDEVLLMHITNDEFDDFIRNNYQNSIDIMRSVVKGYSTLCFNINQLIDELLINKDDHSQSAREIALKMKQYTLLDAAASPYFMRKI